MAAKSALVMRAPGRQGSGAILHLVKAGWQVHALVTDVNSERALALKSFGPQVTLYQDTWKDPPTIASAIEGCQALFFNQLPSQDDSEVQEAHVILALAKEAGVRHVVFPSSLPLNSPTARADLEGSPVAPSILNKGDVEELVKASGLTWTIIRPGYFLSNLLPPLIYWVHPDMKENKLVNSYGPDCNLPLVDPDDIGAFVAAAFEDSAKFGSQIITVVSEIARFDDILQELGKVSGEPIKAVYRTAEETEKLKDDRFVASQLVCVGMDKLVDMDQVRSWGVPLTSMKQFFENHKHGLPRASGA